MGIKMWNKDVHLVCYYQLWTDFTPCCIVRGVLWKKVFLEISQNSQENTCARVSFLIKLQASGLRPATVLKKGLWHRCFPNNSAKFLRTLFHRTPLGYCFSTVDFEHVDSHWGFLLLRYHVSIFIYIICFTLFDVL